jgi:hypothetical protein
MAQMIAVIRWGKVVDILPLRKRDIEPPRDPKDDTARLVNVTGRPDIKVGDSFPFSVEPKKEDEPKKEGE